MERRGRDTEARILRAAANILRSGGPSALTFDRIASDVGVTKQAVLYWFPNKGRLIEAMVRPSLELEANVGIQAVTGRRRADTAIRAFVEAVAAFHVSDLDRFRLMYVAPQIGHGSMRAGQLSTLGQVHPATTRMHDALAEVLLASGRHGKRLAARRAAAAIHMAVLGTVMRIALSDSLSEPLGRNDALIPALAGVLAPGAEAA